MSEINVSSDNKERQYITLGIALSPTYGTVAFRNDTGDLLGVAKVSGDHDYVKMMKRLSKRSSVHPSPPYRTLGESIADWPRQTLRHVLKGVGLPASSDVGTIARMINDLKEAVLAQVGTAAEIRGAILSLPSIIALYEEDVCDAFEYRGIRNLVGTHIISSHPRAITAAFAGYGLGACEHWRDPETCSQERLASPFHKTLLVEYSQGSLSVEVDSLKFPLGYRFYDSHDPIVDFDAGSNSHILDEGEPHWQRVKSDIQTVIERSSFQTLNTILLSGESAEDPTFGQAVRDATKAYGDPEIHSMNPEFVAANGVSEMAWKAVEVQGIYPRGHSPRVGPP